MESNGRREKEYERKGRGEEIRREGKGVEGKNSKRRGERRKKI